MIDNSNRLIQENQSLLS
jgi:hypothetical protein